MKKDLTKCSLLLMARIKRIMRADEEIGKLAHATPILMCKALDLFIEALVNEGLQDSLSHSSSKLFPINIKRAVGRVSMFDFLKDKVSSIPEHDVGITVANNVRVGSRKRESKALASSSSSSSSSSESDYDKPTRKVKKAKKAPKPKKVKSESTSRKASPKQESTSESTANFYTNLNEFDSNFPTVSNESTNSEFLSIPSTPLPLISPVAICNLINYSSPDQPLFAHPSLDSSPLILPIHPLKMEISIPFLPSTDTQFISPPLASGDFFMNPSAPPPTALPHSASSITHCHQIPWSSVPLLEGVGKALQGLDSVSEGKEEKELFFLPPPSPPFQESSALPFRHSTQNGLLKPKDELDHDDYDE